MALVSHRKKFIFLKTSKTAGTSIEGFLERYCLPEGQFTPKHARPETITEAGIIGARPGKRSGNPKYWSHMSASALKKCVGDDIWETYYKISAVRDPYDKVVSSFFHKSRQKGNDLSDVPREIVMKEFRTFVLQGTMPVDRDKYTISDKLCTNQIIRYEHLHEDLKKVAEHLGLEYENDMLPTFKAGQRPQKYSLVSLFDDQLSSRVEEAYKFEFENFGYQTLSERFPDQFGKNSITLHSQVRLAARQLRSSVKAALSPISRFNF